MKNQEPKFNPAECSIYCRDYHCHYTHQDTWSVKNNKGYLEHFLSKEEAEYFVKSNNLVEITNGR